MKKIVSLILALAMIFALGITAFAADDDPATQHIEISFKAVPNRQYYFYRVLDARIADPSKAEVIYEINRTFRDFFIGNTSEGVKGGFSSKTYTDGATPAVYVNNDGEEIVYYLTITETNKEDFAKALKEFIDKEGIAHTKSWKTVSADPKTVELISGFYLITSDAGSALMTTTSYANRDTVVDKNVPPKVEKKVARLDGTQVIGEYADGVHVESGETVRFKITVEVGNVGAENYVIYDNFEYMDEFDYLGGNSFMYIDKDGNEHSMTINEDYTLTIPGANSSGFIWTIDEDFDYSNVKYFVATIDLKALGNVPATGYVNKTYVTYGSSDDQTVEDEAKVYGSAIKIVKTARDENGPALKDAKFILANSDETKYANFDSGDLEWGDEADATEFTTGDDGIVLIEGLRFGETYHLKETVAPPGYNLLPASKEVKVGYSSETGEIKADYVEGQGYVHVENVVNNSGTIIPETGGMGTTLFYILGSLMAVGALVVLVTNKRVRV